MVKTCPQCKGESEHRFKRGLCPACYGQIINREQIRRINRNFVTAWPWNLELWQRYFSYLDKKSYIRNSLPSIAQKLSDALAVRELRPFQSWLDVYELHDELCLGENPLNNGRACPVMMLGILLQREGLLPDKGYTKQLHIQFKWFSGPDRSAIKAHFDFYFQDNDHRHGLRRLRYIREFYVLLRGDFLHATEDNVLEFLRTVYPQRDTLTFLGQFNAVRGFYRWCLDKGLTSKNPFDLNLGCEFKKICTGCHKMKIVAGADNRCKLCRINDKIIPWIEAYKEKLKSSTVYNQYLFELYLQYIKRYRITLCSLTATNALAQFLAQNQIGPLKSWKDVRQTSEQFCRAVKGSVPISRGDPFVKIGRRLSELGVIPYINQDEQTCLDRQLNKLPPDIVQVAQRYIALLLKQRRRITTAIRYLHVTRYLLRWLEHKHQGIHLFQVSEKLALQYLETLRPATRESLRGIFYRFYKWAMVQGIVTINPFENISPLIPANELSVCSQRQVRQILRFIQDPTSQPQSAIMLTLILFFAFSRRELIYSTYEVLEENVIEVGIFRSPLSYGHPKHRRKKKLLLPKTPLWFAGLQRRFLEERRRQLAKLKNPAPIRQLFLVPSVQHNRPMGISAACTVVQEATTKATGGPIPMKVLRMTAGHIHTYHTDASMLAELGWGRDYAFKYTWMPRKYLS